MAKAGAPCKHAPQWRGARKSRVHKLASKINISLEPTLRTFNRGGPDRTDEWRLRFEPVLTPLFRAWWRFHRPMTLGVRTVVRDAAGGYLLVRHGYAAGWHFPGGGVEKGETAAAAAIREAAEEGGVEATSPPVLIGFYANHVNFPNDHIALYRIDSWRSCAPRQGPEIAERRFFMRDALPAGVTAGTLRRLDEIFHGAPPSSEW